MTIQNRTIPRQLKPEREQEHARSPDLGYEAQETAGFVRCLSHGFPTPLARWHYHDEYELHLITATSGKAFVGDWIGPFQPGHVVLTGPRLPHNWLSMDTPEGGVPLRDLVIQFDHEPLIKSVSLFPELAELQPLLERARNGIEFFEMGERTEGHWHRIKQATGLRRLAAFIDLMSDLAACNDYRLLSNVQLQSNDDDASVNQIHVLVTRIIDHLNETHSAATLARELGMSESRFSRFFRKATGNTFTDFVNRVRISRACQLLMDTDQQICLICDEVGFNNVANFNRRFLESKGMTPREFRKQSLTRFRGRH